MARSFASPLAAAALAALLAAAGCSAPFEGRIANQLNEAGLPRPMADCMAAIWVERLSLLQLRKISRLSSDLRDEGRQLTVGRLAERVRQLDDPEIVEVVAGSAVRCALSR
jgi:hypothetical protein